MGFHFVWLAVHDQNPATIGFPAGNPRRELLVGQNDALVVFVPKLVIDGVGTRVPSKPELLDEVLPLLIGLETFESGILFGIDDVGNFVPRPVLQNVASLFILPRLLFGFVILFALPCQCQQGAQEETGEGKDESLFDS